MKKKDLIELIPLLILVIIALYSIVEINTTNYIFGIEQKLGITLLGISAILFFLNRKVYKYVFGITLILGLVNLIGFSKSITSISLFNLPSIQLLVVPIIGIYIWIYIDEIQHKVRGIIGRSKEQLEFESNAQINGFKQRFEKLSDKEIEKKLSENLVPESIEALRQIQKERGISM